MLAIIPTESENKIISEKHILFRWTYIVLPATILLLSIVLAACFYRLLPPEVAYRFKDGLPESWMDRGAIIAWMLVPQFALVLFALAAVSVATILSMRFLPPESTPIRKIVSIMGNMIALPQIILAFAMLEIFLYNAYQIHLVPLWVFALIVMVLGGIILGILFMQALRQFRGLPGKSLQE